MLYSLELVTVSAHFTSCLGSYVNEKSCFNYFLTEYPCVKSVQHRWKLPKFILWCNWSSEAFTVLSEYFHKVTSVTKPVLICIRAAPSPAGRESPQAPPAQAAVGGAASPVHGGRIPKKGPKYSLENKRMHSENWASREGLFGFLSFSFYLSARVCIYFVRWTFKRKTWLEELFKTRNSRVVK